MHLDAQMNEPDFYSDQRRAASIGREHQKLTRLVELYESLMKTEKDLTDNQEMLAVPELDAEM